MSKRPASIDVLGDTPIRRQHLGLLLALLTLIVLPHYGNVSFWITGFFLLAVGTRALGLLGETFRVPRVVLLLLVVVAIANVVVNQGLADGRRAGTALLIVMLGLKLLELKDRRDLYICVFLGYFIVITQFLYSRDLALSLYLFFLVYVLTTLLVGLNQVHPVARRSLASGGRLLLAALPLTVVMFVLFPRLDSPLWALAVDHGSAVSGISDNIRLGSVAKLSLSQAPAFRVRFNGEAPTPAERYWRGPVLWETDGVTWSSGSLKRFARRGRIGGGRELDYEVIMEPTGQTWLFPLDLPVSRPANAKLNSAYSLVTERPLTDRLTFRATSIIDPSYAWPDRREIDAGLQLPGQVAPRIEALVEQWHVELGDADTAAFVGRALRYFREQPFRYTLEPTPTNGDPTASFLFDTREGFCEHYASAFVLLMRVAGVPARIVAGYQGGTFNPHAGHWLVRQSDAHAWAEVWDDAAGWQRVDPTSAVAPQRILRSIAPDLSSGTGQIVFETDRNGLFDGLFREGRWLVDAIDIGWHRWVIGFSAQRQSGLLQDLGLGFLQGKWQGVAMVLFAFLATFVAVVVLRLPGNRRQDPVVRDWSRFRNKLQRKGTRIPDWMGPGDAARLAVRRHPVQDPEIRAIADLYIRLHYGADPCDTDRRALRRRVRRLKLDRAAGT